METKTLTIDQLQQELRGYIGTLNYYRHFTGFGRYTDGVQHLAERAGAYWLIDAIFSWQVYPRIKRVPFQLWTLKVKDREAVLEMREDTDKPTKVSQKIEYTDFPEGEIKLYFTDGVLLLPSEY